MLLIRRGHEGFGPQGWVRNYYVHQPFLEAELRRGLERFANVTVRLGSEVLDISQDEISATIRLADIQTRKEETATAQYVVGCDGARSLVRRRLGPRR